MIRVSSFLIVTFIFLGFFSFSDVQAGCIDFLDDKVSERDPEKKVVDQYLRYLQDAIDRGDISRQDVSDLLNLSRIKNFYRMNPRLGTEAIPKRTVIKKLIRLHGEKLQRNFEEIKERALEMIRSEGESDAQKREAKETYRFFPSPRAIETIQPELKINPLQKTKVFQAKDGKIYAAKRGKDGKLLLYFDINKNISSPITHAVNVRPTYYEFLEKKNGELYLVTMTTKQNSSQAVYSLYQVKGEGKVKRVSSIKLSFPALDQFTVPGVAHYENEQGIVYAVFSRRNTYRVVSNVTHRKIKEINSDSSLGLVLGRPHWKVGESGEVFVIFGTNVNHNSTSLAALYKPFEENRSRFKSFGKKRLVLTKDMGGLENEPIQKLRDVFENLKLRLDLGESFQKSFEFHSPYGGHTGTNIYAYKAKDGKVHLMVMPFGKIVIFYDLFGDSKMRVIKEQGSHLLKGADRKVHWKERKTGELDLLILQEVNNQGAYVHQVFDIAHEKPAINSLQIAPGGASSFRYAETQVVEGKSRGVLDSLVIYNRGSLYYVENAFGSMSVKKIDPINPRSTYENVNLMMVSNSEGVELFFGSTRGLLRFQILISNR